jgi:hypothetical protein
VPELFDMLDRFDIVLAHAPGHQTAPPRIPIPAAFPEFNIGVIAMENNSHIREMWNSVYQRQKDGIATDQAALREVLWEEDPDVLYAVMPWEYNCRFGIGTFLRDPVKILHGRAASAAEYEQIAIDLNAGFHVSE